MSFKRKYLFLVLILIVFVAMIYAFYEYNRKPADLSSIRSFAVVDADSLVGLYESDEGKANAVYLGKPIDVSGTISEINNQQDSSVNVMLGNKDPLHRVSCLLDVKHVDAIKQFKTGDRITVRGICTGYLMDVELNRCVIIR